MNLNHCLSSVLFFSLIFLGVDINAQETLGEECYRCESWQYAARVEALGLEVLPLGRVYLLDRYHDRLKKYLVSSEPAPDGESVGDLPQIKKHKELPEMIADQFNIEEGEVLAHFRVERCSLLIDFWELQPNADEIVLFENFNTLAEDILNIHDPKDHGASPKAGQDQ